jgi:hypothetical protein
MLALGVRALGAQTADVPAAPRPAQIVAAKKVFISNAGVGTDMTYDQFYAAIKGWGRYELVASPADADLVFEISFSSQITGVSGTKESGCDSSNILQLKLVLLDPKTHIALWTLMDTVHPFARQKTGEKNFDDAFSTLVGALKVLTAQPESTAK